ncbi:MAG: hypothetical protein M3547_01400 [Acidobacteriota bacterium]|nr:hypothetical protein [Acidobacteriota bacterium]
MTFDREPVAIVTGVTTAIRATMLALMSFGVIHVTIEQLGGVMIALEAMLALFGGWLARSKVFAPISKDGAALEKVKYAGGAIEAVK